MRLGGSQQCPRHQQPTETALLPCPAAASHAKFAVAHLCCYRLHTLAAACSAVGALYNAGHSVASASSSSSSSHRTLLFQQTVLDMPCSTHFQVSGITVQSPS